MKKAYISLFHDMILAAKSQSASDIHIEPTRDSVEIRFRVYGDMKRPWASFGIEHKGAFLNEVKRLSGLSIAIYGKAQDGRVSFPKWKLDLRVNLLPVLYGEKIVMRLLDTSRSFDLKNIGFEDETLSHLREALSFKNGVILISGPTGSGKSTTLYSLVTELGPSSKNIVTLEDPVEYSLPGINQVQVTSKVGFASGLRSILRQDPDVILVGEIRDEETASLCFKAASTGHLVLSTIHANGAREVCERLLGLGVEKFLLKSNLRFSAAQRLLKRICLKCAVPLSDEGRMIGSGCDQCVGGASGRIAVLEYMKEKSIGDFLSKGEASLTKTFKESCGELIRRGVVDYGEGTNVA